MVDLIALKRANADRWSRAQLTRAPEFNGPAHKAVANKATYLDVVRTAGMPDIAWVFVAVSHYREASQDFTRNLGQGDPLDRVTIHVPKGRGPFLGPDGFVNGAVDALKNCPPYASRESDWSIAGMLTMLERYNGIGYAVRGISSPYLWSGTNQYVRGKFVADGVFDPSVVDKQLGCAGLMMRMMQIDPTITFAGTTETPQPPPKPGPALQPKAVLQPSLWTAFLSAILSIFKRTS